MKLNIIIFTAVLSFLFLSCENLGEFNIFTVSDDVELGFQLDVEIKNNTADCKFRP